MLAFLKEDRLLKITVPLQCPAPHGHGDIQLFRKFQIFADGGPRRKTEKFWQIEKKIGYLHELDNFKQIIFFEKKFSK